MNKTEALKTIEVLESNGFRAVFAGGCVRDHILGIQAKDYDVATDATPQQVRTLFRVLDNGQEYGVSFAVINGTTVDIATLRRDVGKSDGRHPVSVEFTTSFEEDAKRRDFTCNALFMTSTGKIWDFVDGQKDIERKLIRAVGSPTERFQEDYLRILRGLRFSLKLQFGIEDATYLAMQSNSYGISRLSGQRIRDEVLKILDFPGGLFKLIESTLDIPVFGEYGWSITHGFAEHILKPREVLFDDDCSFLHDSHLKLLFVLYTFTKENRLKFYQDWNLESSIREELEFIIENMDKTFLEMLTHDKHERLRHKFGWRSIKLDSIFRLRPEIAEEAYRYSIDKYETIFAPPVVTGKTLIDLGFKPGKRFSFILDQARTMQDYGYKPEFIIREISRLKNEV